MVNQLLKTRLEVRNHLSKENNISSQHLEEHLWQVW